MCSNCSCANNQYTQGVKKWSIFRQFQCVVNNFRHTAPSFQSVLSKWFPVALKLVSSGTAVVAYIAVPENQLLLTRYIPLLIEGATWKLRGFYPARSVADPDSPSIGLSCCRYRRTARRQGSCGGRVACSGSGLVDY